jgi:hypothetical protein
MRRTAPAKRAAYQAARRMGMDRTQAAELAGVSYGTARRLDARRLPACAWCGNPISREDHHANQGA